MVITMLSYKKDMSEVEKFIEPHAEFLNKYYAEGKIIFSGRKNPRTGGIIVFHSVKKEEVMEIVKQDPFYQNKIADYDITEVIPTKYDERFACFMD
jgi:uncharacterized protein YciI